MLELHGWGALQTDLNALSKQGRWEDMGRLIDDDMLHAFAVVDAPESIAGEFGRRYSDVVSRIALYTPYERDIERWTPIVGELTSV